MLALWPFGFTVLAASDLWWHLAAGRWMLEHGELLLTDVWSYTQAGAPWHNESWLAQLLYQGWSGVFGIASLVWWKWLVSGATFTVLWATLWRTTREPIACCAGTLFAAVVAAPFLDLRPQIYSLLGYALVFFLTLGRSRPSAWLLPVFLIWANLHGLFAAGLAALAVMLMPALAGGSRAERRHALAIGAGAVGACLINPSGSDIFTRPITYAIYPASVFRTIAEWRPPFEPGGIAAPFLPWAIGVFVVALVFVLREPRARDERNSVIAFATFAVITLVMALEARRLVSLFALSAGLTLGLSLAPALRRLGAQAHAIALAVVVGMATCRATAYPVGEHVFHLLAAEHGYPVETMNFVEVNRLEGKVFNYYNWGGYLDFRSDGALKVYIDGRGDQVFSKETYLRYLRIAMLTNGWQRVFATSDADFVLWPRERDAFIQALLDSGAWRALYTDSVSVLLARRFWRVDFTPRPTPQSSWRELALATTALDERRYAEAESHLQAALALTPWHRGACERLAWLQTWRGIEASAAPALNRCSGWFPGAAESGEPAAAPIRGLHGARDQRPSVR